MQNGCAARRERLHPGGAPALFETAAQAKDAPSMEDRPMQFLEPIRRSAAELVDTIGDGWDWLRDRSASALTRFRGSRADGSESVPGAVQGDSWGLLASDIARTDDELVVRIEAPGLEEKDFSVSVVSGNLVVRGEKRFEREDRQAHYYLLESAYGAFERRLPLPCDVDADRAEARYRNGVLTVRLPRSENDRRKRIAVEAA